MGAAYWSGVASLEIVGTEENRQFMRLIAAVIDLRKTLRQTEDFSAAMNVIVAHDKLLKSYPDLMNDEVERLIVELQNQEAVTSVEFGLKVRCRSVCKV